MNRRVVITGNRGLIGKSFTDYLLSNGKKVIGLDLNSPINSNLDPKSQLIEFKVDLSNEEQISEVSKKIQDLSIEVDGLIHFASINPKYDELGYGYEIREQQNHEILQALKVGTLGAFSLIKELDEVLSKNCSIVLIGSDLSIVSPNQNIYCNCDSKHVKHSISCKVKPLFYSIDKASVVALTRYLAAFYASANREIRVNCVCLGSVENNTNEIFKRRLANIIPLKRQALLGEFNETFEFMLYKSSYYQTGSVVVVDGGRTII